MEKTKHNRSKAARQGETTRERNTTHSKNAKGKQRIASETAKRREREIPTPPQQIGYEFKLQHH